MSHESKTVGEFVLNRMTHMLDRPRMYAPSPEAFESVLDILDEIYSMFGKPKPAGARYENSVDYFSKHGYNAHTYCSFHELKNPEITRDELWSGLTNAWKDYLSEFVDGGEGCGEHDAAAPK